MVSRMGKVLALSLAAAVSMGGCRSKTYDDPDYLRERLLVGDDHAFRYVRRLDDPEKRVAAIPALIDAYNQGMDQEEVLRILLDIGHPSATPVFADALGNEDTRLAGLAARGLAAVGANDYVAAIAQRLGTVRDPSQYEPFLDALRQMPGRPEVAPALSSILMRPAGQIGGIDTVRFGCEILGNSGNSDPATIEALLHSYVNFIPQPFQDARLECQLALVQEGEAAVEQLWTMFMGQDDVVNARLRSLDYTPEVGSLRAGWALADGASPTVRDRMVGWFQSPPPIDAATLAQLPIDRQQEWYANYGQMFEQAASYLGWVAVMHPVAPPEAATDPAHDMLRQLMARGQGSPLENFSRFMNTSDGAELGLRAAVIRALANIGDPSDRDLLFQVAMAGSLSRGPSALLRQEAAHAFALLSRADDADRFQQLVNAIDDADLRENVEAYRPMIDIAVACHGDDVDCLAGHLTDDDAWAREKAASDLAHYAGNERAAAALLAHIDHPALDTRIIYLQALRRLPLPQTAGETIQTALEATTDPRFRDVRHELLILKTLKLHS